VHVPESCLPEPCPRIRGIRWDCEGFVLEFMCVLKILKFMCVLKIVLKILEFMCVLKIALKIGPENRSVRALKVAKVV